MTDVVIKKGGIIELPKTLMSELGLTVGKKIVLSIWNKELLIKPVENITERITNSIKLEDKKLTVKMILFISRQNFPVLQPIAAPSA